MPCKQSKPDSFQIVRWGRVTNYYKRSRLCNDFNEKVNFHWIKTRQGYEVEFPYSRALQRQIKDNKHLQYLRKYFFIFTKTPKNKKEQFVPISDEKKLLKTVKFPKHGGNCCQNGQFECQLHEDFALQLASEPFKFRSDGSKITFKGGKQKGKPKLCLRCGFIRILEAILHALELKYPLNNGAAQSKVSIICTHFESFCEL